MTIKQPPCTHRPADGAARRDDDNDNDGANCNKTDGGTDIGSENDNDTGNDRTTVTKETICRKCAERVMSDNFHSHTLRPFVLRAPAGTRRGVPSWIARVL